MHHVNSPLTLENGKCKFNYVHVRRHCRSSGGLWTSLLDGASSAFPNKSLFARLAEQRLMAKEAHKHIHRNGASFLRRVLSRSKNSRADAHIRGAHLHSGLVVAGHAHAELQRARANAKKIRESRPARVCQRGIQRVFEAEGRNGCCQTAARRVSIAARNTHH